MSKDNDITPIYDEGLNKQQIRERIKRGECNTRRKKLTRSIVRIITDNIFTLFNTINGIIVLFIISAGSHKNLIFLGVVISNTTISIFQEIRAKLNIDKLAILTQTKTTVIRDGIEMTIPQEEIVIDDIMVIKQGNQITSDGEIIKTSGIEVDESQLTGEADPVEKKEGDKVLSGSYVVAGKAYVIVTAVGADNYAEKLSIQAKREKKPQSELMRSLNTIIKILSIVIVPIGVGLFLKNYYSNNDYAKAVLATAAAMIGMIPEGLILLTSVAFAVSTIKLTKQKILVRTMPSIETLARIDTLCIDKTGTITSGKLKLEEIITINNNTMQDCINAIASLIYALQDENATINAIKEKLSNNYNTLLKPIETMAFSSARKWSGCTFKNYGTLILGAPECSEKNNTIEINDKIRKYQQEGYRVLMLAKSTDFTKEKKLPDKLMPMCIILLSDEIRPDASETFNYLYKQGIALKVISGDNPITVSNIAKKAGLRESEKYIDMSQQSANASYDEIIEKYAIYGRVSPEQKKEIIKSLQEKGHTVAMTGDGVNDVLALKQADCSIAMANGSEASRCISDFVLLESKFSTMINVIGEGRRVVNNIEKVASLYLVKTIYSLILSLLFLFLNQTYPFHPIQLSPINALTVGIPSFFLALKPNQKKIKGRFITNVMENSLPTALLIVINILITITISNHIKITTEQTSTISVILTGTAGFILLLKTAQPLNIKKGIMISTLATAFTTIIIFFHSFLQLANPLSAISAIYIPLALLSYLNFKLLRTTIIVISQKIKKHRRKKNDINRSSRNNTR